ncbi:hypothetical protein ACJX0J_027584 [Zea mays]
MGKRLGGCTVQNIHVFYLPFTAPLLFDIQYLSQCLESFILIMWFDVSGAILFQLCCNFRNFIFDTPKLHTRLICLCFFIPSFLRGKFVNPNSLLNGYGGFVGAGWYQFIPINFGRPNKTRVV